MCYWYSRYKVGFILNVSAPADILRCNIQLQQPKEETKYSKNFCKVFGFIVGSLIQCIWSFREEAPSCVIESLF